MASVIWRRVAWPLEYAHLHHESGEEKHQKYGRHGEDGRVQRFQEKVMHSQFLIDPFRQCAESDETSDTPYPHLQLSTHFSHILYELIASY